MQRTSSTSSEGLQPPRLRAGTARLSPPARCPSPSPPSRPLLYSCSCKVALYALPLPLLLPSLLGLLLLLGLLVLLLLPPELAAADLRRAAGRRRAGRRVSQGRPPHDAAIRWVKVKLTSKGNAAMMGSRHAPAPRAAQAGRAHNKHAAPRPSLLTTHPPLPWHHGTSRQPTAGWLAARPRCHTRTPSRLPAQSPTP